MGRCGWGSGLALRILSGGSCVPSRPGPAQARKPRPLPGMRGRQGPGRHGPLLPAAPGRAFLGLVHQRQAQWGGSAAGGGCWGSPQTWGEAGGQQMETPSSWARPIPGHQVFPSTDAPSPGCKAWPAGPSVQGLVLNWGDAGGGKAGSLAQGRVCTRKARLWCTRVQRRGRGGCTCNGESRWAAVHVCARGMDAWTLARDAGRRASTRAKHWHPGTGASARKGPTARARRGPTGQPRQPRPTPRHWLPVGPASHRQAPPPAAASR